MAYRIVFDGSLSSLEPTQDAPDGYSVFRTFTEAKRELVKHLRSQHRDYGIALKQARSLSKDAL